jgi:CrcB protein
VEEGSVRLLRGRWDVLAVIALGGAVGSLARWALGEALAPAPGEFPWSTFTENLTGGFALGALMVWLTELWPSARYLRPMLAVGVLGGFTTFSTYMLDTRTLLAAGRPGLAAGYLLGTLVLGLGGVFLGVLAGRGSLALARRLPQRGR